MLLRTQCSYYKKNFLIGSEKEKTPNVWEAQAEREGEGRGERSKKTMASCPGFTLIGSSTTLQSFSNRAFLSPLFGAAHTHTHWQTHTDTHTHTHNTYRARTEVLGNLQRTVFLFPIVWLHRPHTHIHTHTLTNTYTVWETFIMVGGVG